ncbi:MAG: hypothetical protein IKP91_04605 [Bacteroidaceae bacterium]|nr:hypothetical protein [Bacteroidaceae bacterium]
MKKTLLVLILIVSGMQLNAQTRHLTRINKSLFTGTTVEMEATNDSVIYYEFGKPGNIILSGDYDEVFYKLAELRQFSRNCSWGDKAHLTENLSIERRGLIGPHAYIITNDSTGTRIRTGFNSISECHHAVWVHRPSNADRIALARKAAKQAAEGENPEEQLPFDGPFGGFGGFPGGFGGPF